MKTEKILASAAEFAALIEEHNIKFTAPQKRVVEKIMAGYRLTVVNKHRANGGEFMWKRVDSDNLEHAGHIYKAFQHMIWAIRHQSGVEVSWSSFIV